MTYEPVEIIAGFFALAVIIKIGFLLIQRHKWLHFAKHVYGYPKHSKVLFTALALIILYYLLLELTIVQIMAVVAFATLLIGIELLEYPKEIMDMTKKILKQPFSAFQTIFIVFWLLLSVWVLYTLF